MLPRIGPLIFVPPGLAAIAVANGTTSAAVTFRWPRALFVTGLCATGSAASASKLAQLSIRIQDESFQDVFADGLGDNFQPLLSLIGQGVRPFALQRPVLDGDQWIVTLKNTDATSTTATLGFYFEEPTHNEVRA